MALFMQPDILNSTKPPVSSKSPQDFGEPKMGGEQHWQCFLHLCSGEEEWSLNTSEKNYSSADSVVNTLGLCHSVGKLPQNLQDRMCFCSEGLSAL